MKTQSEATINAIVNLAQERGYEATPFETDYKTVLTADDQKTVVDMIFAGLKAGEISMTEKSKEKFKDDDKALRRYVVGLVNDRLRKAKAINGNTTYQYKNPGKLTNSRDPQLKALMQVLELHKDTDNEADIQAAIDNRKAEIAVEKQKEVEINIEHLPADLVAKLGLAGDSADEEESTEE